MSGRTGTTPGSDQPRFPGFDALSQLSHWDATTSGVVLSRLALPDPPRFHDLQEAGVARALLDQLLDQQEDPRVPVFEMIDARFAAGQTDGWHYENMPEDGTAWKRSLTGLDEEAQSRVGQGFAQADQHVQAAIVQSVQDAGSDDWHGLPANRLWSLWTRYACTAFYSHPWAWNEMGFPGPAYPRGYKNPGIDRREPFERPDQHPINPARAIS